MQKKLHIFSSYLLSFSLFDFYVLEKHRNIRITNRTLYVFMHVLAIGVITYGAVVDNSRWKLGAIIVGLVSASLVTYSFKGYEKIFLKRKSLTITINDLAISLCFAAIATKFMHVLTVEQNLLELSFIDNKPSLLIIVYIFIFVPIQQLLYMWQPAVVFPKVSKKVLFIGTSIFFALAHVDYGLTVVIFSFFCVGAPSAYLCIYRQNYVAGYLHHCVTGIVGFYLGIV